MIRQADDNKEENDELRYQFDEALQKVIANDGTIPCDKFDKA